MKNKISVSKQQPVPALKTDELIALLEASYTESVNSLFDLVDRLLPALLFLEKALDQDDIMERDLTMNFRGEERLISSPANAAGQIIGSFPEHLFKARYRIDETSTKVMIEMDRYKRAHGEVAAS